MSRWLTVLLGLGALHCDGADTTELSNAPGAPPRPAWLAPPEPPCEPQAVGGPFWLEEQESVSIQLECATGLALAGKDFVPLSLPANASYDPEARRITFAPGLDQAAVYDLIVATPRSAEQLHIELQVADRFDAPGNLPVDSGSYTLEYGVPVLHLFTDPALNRDEYTAASIIYRGKAYAGAQAKYRGQTSFGYPKRSFTLKFAKADRFSDPLSLAGFSGKRKLTLTTTFDDNSYLRARLAFELWNRIGAEHVQVQAYNVVVYLDGEYQGLYTVTDHVDGHLMEEHGLYEDGNLYKAKTHDANFRLTRSAAGEPPKRSLSEGFEKKEGTPEPGQPGANADLEELVAWVAGASDEQFLAELDQHVVQRDYEDWWMLVTLITAGDSAGKNTYHQRDPRVGAPDARFRVVPWDFNESFGQNWRTLRRSASRDPALYTGYNLIFERLLALPESRAAILARYRLALDNEWALPSVLEALDTWLAEIRPVALRDERAWGKRYADHYGRYRTDLTTYEQESVYLRDWVSARWAFMAGYAAEPAVK